MFTVDQAKSVCACRVCGKPINLPSPVWWEGEGVQTGRGAGATFKDGAEFAHTACVDWDEVPFVREAQA